jgi:O-antigen/teichoic acid export membrane protein
VGWNLLKPAFDKLLYIDLSVLQKIIKYGRWMVLWSIAVIIQNRLDIFMLTSLTSVEQVGLYTAAFRISQLATLIPNAYGTVLSTKLASLAGSDKLFPLFKKTLLISGVLFLLIMASTIFAPVLINLITGDKYSASIPILQILLLNWGIYTLNLPFSSLLNAFEKPWIITFAVFITIIQIFITNSVLIPIHKGVGASISLVISSSIVLIICMAGAFFYYRQIKPSFKNTDDQ